MDAHPVDTILLIPAPGSTLLDDACAPVAYRLKESNDPESWTLWRFPSRVKHRTNLVRERAIVLARDGKVQEHGCLTLADSTQSDFETLRGLTVHAALIGKSARLLALVEAHYPDARLVFIAGGVEVAL